MHRLHQGPGKEAQQETAVTVAGPPPSRWTLTTIRATFASIRDYTLSGVWRWLHERVGVELRSATVQQYSPDPEYEVKVRRLKRYLRRAAREPGHVVLVFLDEMGYSVWPEAAVDWCARAPTEPPVADRQKSNNGLGRIGGALNALTGQVTYVDGYVVGRAKVIELYRRLVQTYPQAQKIYAVQDNWSIHTHPEVLEAIQSYPQIQPVWLPTYAPWLNPIEKLWRGCGRTSLSCTAWQVFQRNCGSASTTSSISLPKGHGRCCGMWVCSAKDSSPRRFPDSDYRICSSKLIRRMTPPFVDAQSQS
jgi:hypothetical protein